MEHPDFAVIAIEQAIAELADHNLARACRVSGPLP